MSPPRPVVTALCVAALLAGFLVVAVTVSAVEASGTPALTREARLVSEAFSVRPATRSVAHLAAHLVPGRSLEDPRVERVLAVLRASLQYGAVVSKVSIDGDAGTTDVLGVDPSRQQVRGKVRLHWRRAGANEPWRFDPLAGP